MRPAASHAGKPDAATVARSVDREEPARVLGSIKKPKRPRTAYHFFYDFRRNEVMDAAEDKSTVDNNILSRQIGEEWKKLDVDGRKKYEDDAASAKAEYDALVQQFKDAGGRMHDTVPCKPLSAYMLYFRAKHAQTPDARRGAKRWFMFAGGALDGSATG